MRYIFMNKNTPLLECDIDTKSGTILKVNDVFDTNRAYFPVSLVRTSENEIEDDLHNWWSKRGIPISRKNLHKVLQNIGVSNTKILLIKNLGLNLSDQYWMNPDGQLSWSNVNFFDNEFSDDMGRALFLEPIDRKHFDPTSPDAGSDGVLEKRWTILNGKRTLLKGSNGPYFQEPLNEKIASTILASLDVNHVDYSIRWDNEKPYSLCETFIDCTTELVPAGQMATLLPYEHDDCVYKHFINVCSTYNVKDIEQKINEMIVLDFIMENQDRHFNNFGLIRNVETLEWKGFAPIYDTGTSLWCYDQTPGKKVESFVPTFEMRSNAEQLKLVTDFSWINFERLSGALKNSEEILKQSPHISKERRQQIIVAIDKRLDHLDKLIHPRKPTKNKGILQKLKTLKKTDIK